VSGPVVDSLVVGAGRAVAGTEGFVVGAGPDAAMATPVPSAVARITPAVMAAGRWETFMVCNLSVASGGVSTADTDIARGRVTLA
jgi:hypothetical protein